MYQVTWFNKKTGFGFAVDGSGNNFFCHFKEINVEPGSNIFRYLVKGEFISATEETVPKGKKLTNISPPESWGKLMCQVEAETTSQRQPKEQDQE